MIQYIKDYLRYKRLSLTNMLRQHEDFEKQWVANKEMSEQAMAHFAAEAAEFQAKLEQKKERKPRRKNGTANPEPVSIEAAHV